VAQVDAQDYVMYMVQDANYTVVGLFDESGAPVAQYTYSPYGQIVAYDEFDGAHAAANRVGHQGLFFDRIAGDPVNGPTLLPWPPAHPGAPPEDHPKGLYYTRNRHYDPFTGRFFSSDRSGTGLPVTDFMAFNGNSLTPGVGVFSLSRLYQDGANLFLFVGANPPNRVDPTGLSSGLPSESDLLLSRDFDAIWDSVTGDGAAYLGVQGASTFGAFWGGNVTMLPEGALRSAGLSMGFSEFADFYAEQLMYLPVEGALAGMGCFGRVAVAGQTVGKVRRGPRLARLAATDDVWHHAIPKFLGGDAAQYLKQLPRTLHTLFHRELREALKAAGFPRRLFGGPTGSTRKWLEYFKRSSGKQRKAFDILLDVSRSIDERYGTSIVQSAWKNIMEGLFTGVF
ncbi:MAG: hypothetical protein JSW71_05785, partial [Gemmatimonadota bacterium]